MQTRLPRFTRAPIVAPMQLGARDCQIIRLVHRHRFLRSDQIVTLVGGSQQQILRRLQLLFHHGYPDAAGQSQRVYFFLEADRGTMPVKRQTLSQTSFNRKLLAYEATWTQDIHRRHLGINRFRVLTVTTSAARVKSLVEACSELARGHGLFLFTDKSVLSGDLFAHLWQSGKHGETGGLLN